MYYKIRNDILFRQYPKYGYITDNSEFGYHYTNNNRYYFGEKYVSKCGAIMLATLNKQPKHIDNIIKELSQIFTDVDYSTLKQDTIDFFQWLAEQGYLCFGNTYDECLKQELNVYSNKTKINSIIPTVNTENYTKELFSPNDFLRSIHIEITSTCNEKCVHCYIPHKCKNKMIDSKLFYQIIEEGRMMNIVHVTLSGGEPLLHKDLKQFLIKCRELDLSVNILSNLTLLTKDLISEMKKNPLLSVQTSLYSMNPLIHDSITQLTGSFEKTKQGILQLISSGIPLQISCPIMKQNQKSFLDVIHWGKKHNIAVAIEPVIFASYDHSKINLKNRLSLKEITDVLDKQLPEGYADIIYETAKEKELLTENNPICSICRYSFCVSAEGNVFPCAGWQTNIIGNLNQQTIKEIWEKSEKIQQLRQIKRNQFPKCITCKDRGYCTICMMRNSNENPDGNVFHINNFYCKIAEIIHNKVNRFLKENPLKR